MRPSFQAQLTAARQWEHRVAACLSRHGYFVLPTAEYSGSDNDKAPKLISPAGGPDLVIPDLLACRGGQWVWVEVKYKSEATYYRNLSIWETGIGTRLWTHYREVQRVTGVPVWVVFVHQREDEIRAATLGQLETVWSHDGAINGKSTTFFRYDGIGLIGDISVLESAHSGYTWPFGSST